MAGLAGLCVTVTLMLQGKPQNIGRLKVDRHTVEMFGTILSPVTYLFILQAA